MKGGSASPKNASPARTDGKGPRRRRKINIRKLRLSDSKENSAERLARPG